MKCRHCGHETDNHANPDMLIMARWIRMLTQAELSEYTGIDQGRISRYENGIVDIPAEHVELFSDVLQFPTTYFYRAGKLRRDGIFVCKMPKWA